jgi:cation diffusion facilitator family transporter
MLKPSSSKISQEERYIAIRNVTLLAIFLDIVLIIFQVIAGIIGHSQALIAEALHTFSDLISSGITLIAAKYSTQPPDLRHPYGHARFETLATVAVGGLLLLTTAGLLIDAQRRLFDPALLLTPTRITIIVAILSIVVQESLYHYTISIAKRVRSPMLRANAWHHRSDAISAGVALIGVVGSMLGFLWLDILATIVIAIMIGYVGLSLSLPAINELVDTGLPKEELIEIEEIIKSVKGVRSLHQLRTRKMGINILVDIHILLDPRISVSEGHKISTAVRTRLIAEIPEITEVLVHIDVENDEIAKTISKLPSRDEITARLQQHWQSLEVAGAIEQITLHYLSGQLTIDIYLPLTLVQDFKEAQLLSQRFTDLIANDPDIDSINIYYRSTAHKPIQIFKASELGKLIAH